MSPAVTVVDYGVGNLYSVRRALETVGAEVTLSADASTIERAPRLVLPGVGAFADGMVGLRERGLVESIRRFAESGRPLLGICLGMQLLASVGEEFGEHEGLGLIRGRVVAIPQLTVDGARQKIPNVGWRALQPTAEVEWSSTVLSGTTPGTSVYLVHSYHLVPYDPAHVLAWSGYGGHRITAAVCSDRIIGCQFHPEKSGPAGLAILSRFVHG